MRVIKPISAQASRITAVQSLMISVVCDGGNGVVLCCRRHLKLLVGSVCPYRCPQTMFAAVDVDACADLGVGALLRDRL